MDGYNSNLSEGLRPIADLQYLCNCKTHRIFG